MARTRAEITQAIDDLQTMIDSAATSNTVDGESTTWDQQKAKQRLIELQDELASLDGCRSRRPQWFSVYLGHGPG